MHAVLPITPLQWLVDRRLVIFPHLVAKHPQLRAGFYRNWFFDDAQAWLTLGLAGTLAAAWWPWALLAWLPYFRRRIRDDTTAKGLRRLARPLLYLPRDLCSFACLLAGSIRYRTLLL
jgi:hypothetical protein